jgi:hypothetical protein
VPGFIIDTDARRQITCVHPVDVHECLFAHRRLDIAALAVDPVQDCRVMKRRVHVVREQALNADRNILEAPGGVDSRTSHKAEIGTGRPCELATGLTQ